MDEINTYGAMRQFDLNIEKVLEHWTMAHAMREVIANALDEQALTGTQEPEIYRDDTGAWHVRDFGRGLSYEHLTQKENNEKLRNPERIIGKFGVGLKDALATADRRHVKVLIRSAHGDITIGKAGKHGFSDVVTLHAHIHPPSDPHLIGTDVILSGLKDEDVTRAKDFFMRYSGEEMLEDTKYGMVLRKKGNLARIYVNGLCVAEEENFLFSYNITSLTAKLRKALNRERTNVGRTAYTDRVRTTLLECTGSIVADSLANDLCNFETGAVHDELQWLDVALHACRILNANEKVVFVTSHQLLMGGSLIAHAQADGYRVIVVPQSIANKLPTLTDVSGAPVRDLVQYGDEWNDSFEFNFVSLEALTEQEGIIFRLTQPILKLAGKQRTKAVKQVLISETMRLVSNGDHEAVGLWDSNESRIIIKRTQLQDVQAYVATLLHEVAHASTGGDDLTDEFENGLTELLGVVGFHALTPEAIVTESRR